jgi:predicted nucleic acid-binding protein
MSRTSQPLCVLDASIAAGWLIGSQATPYKTSVLNALIARSAVALVPSLWHLEIANLISIRFKRGLVPLDSAQELSLFAENLPVVTDDFEMTSHARAKNWRISAVFDLAAKQGLTSYDAIYLQTAVRTGLPLATADEALVQAAKRSGVQIFQP